MFQWLHNLLFAFTTNTNKITVDINEFDQDPLGWSRDLLEHQLGEFSMAAVQANGVTEDRSQLDVGNKALFVGIYHGQNGPEASNFLSTNLCEDLIRRIQQNNNNNMSENILRQVVAEMEESFMTDVEESNQQQPELAIVGSSCLFCIVWRGKLYIANLGDSLAVMGYLDPFNKLDSQPLVKDHSARNRHIKKELKKLHPKDPTIVTYNFDAWRVGGVSEVSRCVGNAYLKRRPFTLTPSFQVPQSELSPSDFTRPLLSAEPATSSRVLYDHNKFIIFGSGGLWKLLTKRKAAEIVHTNPRDGIAKRLLTTALEIAARRNNITYSELRQIPAGHGVIRGPSVSVEGTRRAYHDDISVIVVFFDKKPELNPTVMPVVTSVPAIGSFRNFSDAIHPSPFRSLDVVFKKSKPKIMLPLAWSRPLIRHHYGEFSMAAVQANMDMEDQSQVEVGTDALFVGVYDGHKGDTAAIYLRNHFFRELLSRIQQNNNLMTELILRQVVHQMERDFIEFARNSFEQQHEVQNSFVSSGCLICIIWKGRLFVANVGDSRAILGFMKSTVIYKILAPEQIVRDHNFLNPDIQQELAELQSDQNNRYPYQSIEVKGLIETSRCIGYAYLKNAKFTKRRSFEIPLSEVVTPTLTRPLLLSEPDVTSRALRDTDRFIILGSSGFWKLMSNDEAAEVVNTRPRDGIAETLAKLALEKGARERGKKYAELLEIPASNCVSGNNGNQNLAFRPAYHDDITVVVVYLDQGRNREGVKPKINSYIGYDDTVRQSEFRNFYNNANA